jgi:hypothetical protein
MFAENKTFQDSSTDVEPLIYANQRKMWDVVAKRAKPNKITGFLPRPQVGLRTEATERA